MRLWRVQNCSIQFHIAIHGNLGAKVTKKYETNKWIMKFIFYSHSFYYQFLTSEHVLHWCNPYV